MTLKEFLNNNTIGTPRRMRACLEPGHQARAAAVFQILGADMANQTLESWLDGFCYDMHPEREIAVWERYAVFYKAHATGRSNVERKVLYAIIIQHIMNTDVEDVGATGAGTPKAVGEAISAATSEAHAAGVDVDVPALDAKIASIKADFVKQRTRVLDDKIRGMGKTYARMWRLIKDDLSRIQDN
jgi:hypothetical protein